MITARLVYYKVCPFCSFFAKVSYFFNLHLGAQTSKNMAASDFILPYARKENRIGYYETGRTRFDGSLNFG